MDAHQCIIKEHVTGLKPPNMAVLLAHACKMMHLTDAATPGPQGKAFLDL